MKFFERPTAEGAIRRVFTKLVITESKFFFLGAKIQNRKGSLFSDFVNLEELNSVFFIRLRQQQMSDDDKLFHFFCFIFHGGQFDYQLLLASSVSFGFLMMHLKTFSFSLICLEVMNSMRKIVNLTF